MIGQASPEGPAKIEDTKLESVKTYKDLVEVYKQTGEREHLEKFVEGLKGNIDVEFLRKLKDPKAKKAFKDRHNCEQKKDKTKAGYWACRLPRYAKSLGLSGGGQWW